MEDVFHPFVLVENTPIIPAAEGGVPTNPIWWGGYMIGRCFHKPCLDAKSEVGYNLEHHATGSASFYRG